MEDPNQRICVPLEVEMLPLYRQPPGTARRRREDQRAERRARRQVRKQARRQARRARLDLPGGSSDESPER